MPYALPSYTPERMDRDDDWWERQGRENTGISGYGFPNGRETPPLERIDDPDRNTTMPVPPRTPADPGARDRAVGDFMRGLPQGTSPDDAIRRGYTSFLGRDADEEGLASHRGNPRGVLGALETMYDAEEGQAFRDRPAATTPETDPAPGGAAGAGRRGWANQRGTGLNLDRPASRGDYGALEGFNTERAFAGGDENSVKDAFVRWVTGLGFNPARASKAEIEQVLRDNMDSAAEYGLNILDVDGENILIETAERGPEWVDVVRGAGAGPDDPDAAWQWGAAPDGGAGGEGGEGGGGMFGLPGMGGPPDEMLEALGGGNGDLLERIRRELEALVNGSASPMGRDAMLQQLEGGR